MGRFFTTNGNGTHLVFYFNKPVLFLFVDPHFGTISEKTMGHAQMEKRVQRKGRAAGVALPFLFWA